MELPSWARLVPGPEDGSGPYCSYDYQNTIDIFCAGDGTGILRVRIAPWVKPGMRLRAGLIMGGAVDGDPTPKNNNSKLVLLEPQSGSFETWAQLGGALAAVAVLAGAGTAYLRRRRKATTAG
ncbi:hypothetical protein ACIQUQ_27980 [Streptomyces sp. NPDC101118]|uniref:hypothetical protein n=1 Tax=Streptomyces sp. NPDC101118 TaxID=3366109 RepID=UPI00381321DB